MKTNEIKMNTCPKCGSPQVEEQTNYAKETGRTWWVCGTFQTRDCHPHHSELCLEREEKNTLQRKVEEFAEDLCVERIAHANTIRKLDDKHKQVCELKRERNRLIDDLQASTIHSCGDSCSRPMCVLRRERDAYKEALQMCVFWAESISRRVTEDRDSINWTGLQIARKALADIQKEAK
jgi:hypothetical protein